MSVLGIDQKLRRSFNKLKSYGTESEQEPASNESSDSGIFLQTFLHHWGSCQQTFLKYEPESSQVQDDVINVTAQLEQMIELLKYEATMCVSTSILDFILSENVLGQLVAWSKSLPSHIVGPVVNQELLVFEFLLLDKERGLRLLSHQTILRPLVNVLEMCENLQNSISEETLLGLVHSVSIVLMESPELIQLFLSSSTSKNLVLFSLLTPYLHKPGILGQRAKESILIYVSMSSSHKIVENIIGESNFCLILATGLSALFSALPSNLEADHPSWHKLDIADCQVMPELNAIMSSFELCAAVVEVSPASISNQLLSLVQSGFLTSILGPALTSDSESELVSYTAYLNFFLTEISTEALTSLFIRFLLTEEVDGKPIKDILVSRIILSSQVGVVTLALFETILSFNLEDVMFSLIFQHLISCTFLIPSYRDKIRYTDPQGRGTNKFLSLVPVSCDPPVTPVTPRRTPFSSPRSNPPPPSSSPRSLDPTSNLPLTNQNFDEYTREARQLIRTTVCDCIHWRNQYDGTDTYHQQQQSANLRLGKQIGSRKGGPAGGAQLENDPLEDAAIEAIEGSAGPGSLSGESSGYLSGNWEQDIEEVQLSAEEEREFWSAVGGDKQRLHSVLARLQHEDRLSLSSLGQESHGSTEVSPRPSLPLQEEELLRPCPSLQPSLGPFLSSLLDRVQTFHENSLTLNLRLTAILSKLATFPQPLLRSVLTHPDVIVQPSCITLIQAICTARSRLDSVMPGLLGAEEAVRQARQYLNSRVNPERGGGSTVSITSLPATLGEYSRRGSKLLTMFGRRPLSTAQKATASIPPHTHRMAMAAVLLEEWLHELAAISQEHSLLEQQASILQ